MASTLKLRFVTVASAATLVLGSIAATGAPARADSRFELNLSCKLSRGLPTTPGIAWYGINAVTYSLPAGSYDVYIDIYRNGDHLRREEFNTQQNGRIDSTRTIYNTYVRGATLKAVGSIYHHNGTGAAVGRDTTTCSDTNYALKAKNSGAARPYATLR